jgi:MFS family permease
LFDFEKIRKSEIESTIIEKTQHNWRRNLYILCLAQFIAMVGMSSCVPFLPLYVRKLGITDLSEAQVWSSLVLAGPYFLATFAVPFWGVLGDRYGKKLMVIRAIFGLAVAMTLMGFSQNVYQLFTLRVIQGGVSGFIAAALAFVSANTPEEHSGYAIGMLQSSTSAGNIVGPFFGGILSDVVGMRNVFFVVGFFCILSGFTIIKFVKDNSTQAPDKTKTSVCGNLKYLRHNPVLLSIIIIIVISQGGSVFANPVFPYFVEKLGAPQETLSTITGIMVGIIGVFSVLFAPFWGKRSDKKDYKKTLKVATIISGIAMLLHLLAPEWGYLIPLRIIIGIFFAAIVPTLLSALSKQSPPEIKGGMMGLASSAQFLGVLSSYLFCGVVATGFGMEACFIVSGILLLIVSPVDYWISGKKNLK